MNKSPLPFSIEQLRILEDIGVFGVQKLTKLGGSYAIILPKEWVEYYAYEISDVAEHDEKKKITYWIQVIVGENGELKISPLNISELIDSLKYVREKTKSD